jgi:phage-related protein
LEEDIKPVIWLGDSLKEVKNFPPEARKEVGVAIYEAQLGSKSPYAKPFRNVGSGVFEIAIRFDKNAYRVVYAVQIGRQVYVLHAFNKKSKTRIETPLKDINLIKQRYRQSLDMENEK